MKYIAKDLPYQKDKIQGNKNDLTDYFRILLTALKNNFSSLEEVSAYNEITYVESAAQPDVRDNTFVLWNDTAGNYYLLASFNGTVKKVAMT